jgi:hypothetical protein
VLGSLRIVLKRDKAGALSLLVVFGDIVVRTSVRESVNELGV